MMREVSLETLPNVNIRDPSHDKNLPITNMNNYKNWHLDNLSERRSFQLYEITVH